MTALTAGTAVREPLTPTVYRSPAVAPVAVLTGVGAVSEARTIPPATQVAMSVMRAWAMLIARVRATLGLAMVAVASVARESLEPATQQVAQMAPRPPAVLAAQAVAVVAQLLVTAAVGAKLALTVVVVAQVLVTAAVASQEAAGVTAEV